MWAVVWLIAAHPHTAAHPPLQINKAAPCSALLYSPARAARTRSTELGGGREVAQERTDHTDHSVHSSRYTECTALRMYGLRYAPMRWPMAMRAPRGTRVTAQTDVQRRAWPARLKDPPMTTSSSVAFDADVTSKPKLKHTKTKTNQNKPKVERRVTTPQSLITTHFTATISASTNRADGLNSRQDLVLN